MIRQLVDRWFIKQPRVRRAATKLLFGARDRDVSIFGSKFRINSIRENGYVRAASKIRGCSLLEDEVAVLLSLGSILKGGDTFVDVGANIGLFCTTLARINRFEPGAVRFYAYEPHPDTFKRLVVNVRADGVIAKNCALSDGRRRHNFVDGAVSHVFTVAERKSPYSIPTATVWVDALPLDSEPIDGNSIVLKIDVEGQELAVLRGSRQLFNSRRVKAVYLDGYSDAAAVEKFLCDYGFRFWNGRTAKPFRSGDFSLLALRDHSQLQ